jgi:hypothetical protein
MARNLRICALVLGFIAVFHFSLDAPMSSDTGDRRAPLPNEVMISGTGVRVPLGRFNLLRKGEGFCAVKFTRIWDGANKAEWFAAYESYYQTNGTGDFTASNVQVTTGEVSHLAPIPTCGGHYWPRGDPDVRCGPMKVFWGAGSSLHFFESKDIDRIEQERSRGFELAPTKWADIREVDVFDPRLRWYGYGQVKKTIYVPVDELW